MKKQAIDWLKVQTEYLKMAYKNKTKLDSNNRIFCYNDNENYLLSNGGIIYCIPKNLYFLDLKEDDSKALKTYIEESSGTKEKLNNTGLIKKVGNWKEVIKITDLEGKNTTYLNMDLLKHFELSQVYFCKSYSESLSDKRLVGIVDVKTDKLLAAILPVYISNEEERF